MLQVRDGAGETLGVLFERYHVPLYNFYTKLTGDRALSEDLVQEVFLRILRASIIFGRAGRRCRSNRRWRRRWRRGIPRSNSRSQKCCIGR